VDKAALLKQKGRAPARPFCLSETGQYGLLLRRFFVGKSTQFQ
jgi:hypothetical protein